MSPENLKVSLQTSTPKSLIKMLNELILTLIYGETIGDFFHPESEHALPSLTSFQTRKTTFLVTTYFCY